MVSFHLLAPIAQWLEPTAHNGVVPGSSPGRGTNYRVSKLGSTAGDREIDPTGAMVSSHLFARIAHLVEQLICNQQVVGSSPAAGAIIRLNLIPYK